MSPRMSPAAIRAHDLRQVARHEAGHAVIAALLDREADYVEISPRDISDEDLGRSKAVTGQLVGCSAGDPGIALCVWRARPVRPGSAASRRLAVAATVRIALAGAAAVDRDPETPLSEQWDEVPGNGQTDFEKVTAVVSGVLGPSHASVWTSDRFAAAVDEEWVRTLDCLEIAREAVDRVALALRRREELDWDEVLDLIGTPPPAAVERIQEVPTWTKWAAPVVCAPVR